MPASNPKGIEPEQPPVLPYGKRFNENAWNCARGKPIDPIWGKILLEVQEIRVKILLPGERMGEGPPWLDIPWLRPVPEGQGGGIITSFIRGEGRVFDHAHPERRGWRNILFFCQQPGG